MSCPLAKAAKRRMDQVRDFIGVSSHSEYAREGVRFRESGDNQGS
jgi:hypothetical protein